MPQYSQYNVPTKNIMVNFGVGQPDTRKLPLNLFKETLSNLGQNLDVSEVLQYGQIPGYQSFRNVLAKWLCKMYFNSENTDNCDEVEPDELFITTGNTGALHLIMTIFMKSGDTIFVEEPSYFIAIKMFKEFGLNIEPIPMTKNGIDTTILNRKLSEFHDRQDKIFLYTIPFHHNPTGICMSEHSKLILAKLCDRFHNFYVLSDEVYQFLQWCDTDAYNEPLANYHDHIVSMGTFSKILAPSLRVGWIFCCNNDNQSFILNKLNSCALLDSSGGLNTIGCLIVEQLIKNNKLDKYIETCINFLSSRSKKMIQYLNENNSMYVEKSFIKPEGGYFLWLKLNIENTKDLLQLAIFNKVKFHNGDKFSCKDNFKDYVRLSFSYYDEDDLVVGLDRLKNSIYQFNSIKVSIHGESGRLGSLIKKELNKKDGFYKLEEITREYMISAGCNVIVDVSSAEGTKNLLEKLLSKKITIPLVIGTTGNLDKRLIEQYSKRAPVAVISNFSEGVPLMKRLLQDMNSLSEKWNASMVEKHHTNKKDAPSGTALTLQKFINRQCKIMSVREGDIFGQHFITFESDHEVIEVKHTAKTRRLFAVGCLRYLSWIINQKPALYYRITKKLNNDLPLEKTTPNDDFKPPKYDVVTNGVRLQLYSACGNILMIVENINSNYGIITKNLARKYNIDGVIFMKYDTSSNKSIIWSYYNKDGKQVAFCGNGARCLGKYMYSKYNLNYATLCNKDIKTPYKVDNDGNVCIKMPEVLLVTINKTLYDNIKQEIKSIYPGNKVKSIRKFIVAVPHLVIQFENPISNIDNDIINCLGAVINDHYPDGVNVNFLYVTSELNLKVRTYERGVNNETGSCGTGCIACFVNFMKYRDPSKFTYNNLAKNILFVKNNYVLKAQYCNNQYYLSGKVIELDHNINERCSVKEQNSINRPKPSAPPAAYIS